MDSTRAGLLLSEAKNLINSLNNVWRGYHGLESSVQSSRLVGKKARVSQLRYKAVRRRERRYDLWCDSND